MPSWLAALSFTFGAGACVDDDGTGFVEAKLTPAECPKGKVNAALADLRFDAGWLSTERYIGILYIQIFDHQVRLEEGDGLSIRLPVEDLTERGLLVVDAERDRLVRANSLVPLSIPVGIGPSEANGSLSLYNNCPDAPSFATTGVVHFTELVLAVDGEDTGNDERVAGTFTATLTRGQDPEPLGTVRSEFDFLPPRQPLATFK